jgi:hypothetical protein
MSMTSDDPTLDPPTPAQHANAPDVLRDVLTELRTALDRFPPMRSPHEGYAILLEEVEEMWDAIKANDGPASRKEAVQVAAMAIRYLMDVGEGSNK